MSDRPVHLELTGRLTYADDLSVAEAAQIISFIDAVRAGGTPVLGTTQPSPAPAPSMQAEQSGVDSAREQVRHRTAANPRDALDVTGAKTNPERIVALAAYVLQDGELETFTLDTIRPLFRRAREVTPGNLNRDLDSAIASGWISETETKGELYLTARVENILEVGFESIRVKRNASGPRQRASSSRKARTIETPAAFESIDIFSVKMEGFPTYGSLKLKRDKLLWAVELAKKAGLTGIDNKQVVWLTDKLGDGIVSNDVNGHFRGLQKPGYVNRSTVENVIRITESGESYLKSLKVSSE